MSCVFIKKITSLVFSGRGEASHKVVEFGMSKEYVLSDFGISPSAGSGMGGSSDYNYL